MVCSACLPVIFIWNIHREFVRIHPQTGLKPVSLLSCRVEVEVGNVEGFIIQNLNWIRPQLLQVCLVNLREPLQEVSPRNLGVVGDEDVGKVDSKSWTPY